VWISSMYSPFPPLDDRRYMPKFLKNKLPKAIRRAFSLTRT
jgi:hypothetical protein